MMTMLKYTLQFNEVDVEGYFFAELEWTCMLNACFVCL